MELKFDEVKSLYERNFLLIELYGIEIDSSMDNRAQCNIF